MEIAFSFDKNYVNQTKVSISSLYKHNDDISFLLLIVGKKDEFTNLEQWLLNLNAVYRFVEIDEYFDNTAFKGSGRHIKTVYSKFFIPDISTNERTLYLDSDTFVMASIAELDNLIFSNKILAMSITPTNHLVEHYKLATDKFYNDGVVLLNNKMCKSFKLKDKILREFKLNNNDPLYLSEGLINSVAQGNIQDLPPRFNMLSGNFWIAKNKLENYINNYYDLDEELKNVIIVHFIAGFYNRPWNYPCFHPLKSEYRNEMKNISWLTTFSKPNIRVMLIGVLSKILGNKLTILKKTKNG